MNIQFPLNKAINDLSATLQNDLVMQHIVSKLVEKINSAKIVKPQYKTAISQYYHSAKSQPVPLATVGISNLQNAATKDLLLLATIYFLSDLNDYDFYLINYAFQLGLAPENIIVLLLLNNIYDIEIFCRRYNIYGEGYYTISTLKKLSALNKLWYNY